MLVDTAASRLTSIRGTQYPPPPPGAYAVAACPTGHAAPARACGCGWYGVQDLDALAAYLTKQVYTLRLPPGRVALVAADVGGRSLPPRRYFGMSGLLDPPTTRRWEFVRVTRVHLPGESKEAAGALQAAYGLPTLVHATKGAAEFYASVAEVEDRSRRTRFRGPTSPAPASPLASP